MQSLGVNSRSAGAPANVRGAFRRPSEQDAEGRRGGERDERDDQNATPGQRPVHGGAVSRGRGYGGGRREGGRACAVRGSQVGPVCPQALVARRIHAHRPQPAFKVASDDRVRKMTLRVRSFGAGDHARESIQRSSRAPSIAIMPGSRKVLVSSATPWYAENSATASSLASARPISLNWLSIQSSRCPMTLAMA